MARLAVCTSTALRAVSATSNIMPHADETQPVTSSLICCTFAALTAEVARADDETSAPAGRCLMRCVR
jgi:hypothetical protein